MRKLKRSIAKSEMQRQGYSRINRCFSFEWRNVLNDYLKNINKD